MRLGTVFAVTGAVLLSAMLGGTLYYVTSRQATDTFAQCRSGTMVGGTIGGAWIVAALHALAEQTGSDPAGADVLQGTSAGAEIVSLDKFRKK